MKVQWHSADSVISETTVTDIEQLLLLLRLVHSVVLKEASYQIDGSELIVEDDELSVAVHLSPYQETLLLKHLASSPSSAL